MKPAGEGRVQQGSRLGLEMKTRALPGFSLPSFSRQVT